MNPGKDLLAGLDPEQARAVTAAGRPVVVIAAAGSGKTRVLTRRIAYGVRTGTIDPIRSMAVTFTRKAAAELWSRLTSLGVEGVTTGTFHALAYRMLRQKSAEVGHPAPVVVANKSKILADVIASRPLPGVLGNKATLRELAVEIEWAKVRMIPPHRYAEAAAARSTTVPKDQISDVYARYEREKPARGLVDFEDVLSYVAKAVESDPHLASAVRLRFRHFFVDEFQDVSPLQARLLNAWLGDRDDLFAVGDPNQSIFGFAGGDSGYLTSLVERYPGATLITLNKNYRSTGSVVKAASSILPPDTMAPPEAGLAEGTSSPVTVHSHPTDTHEADAVAAAIRNGRSSASIPWRRFAILFRTNSQSALLESALTRMKIPYVLHGKDRFLSKPEIVQAMKRIRSADRPPGISFAAHVRDVLGESGIDTSETLETLARLAVEYDEDVGSLTTAADFAAYVDRVMGSEYETDDPRAGVNLLSMHAAKGLEFDTVHIVGLEEGLVPIAHALTAEQLDEERRLLYVAMTRARRKLDLHWASTRTFGSTVTERTRSRYLDDISGSIAREAFAHESTRDWRAELQRLRKELASRRA